MNDQHRDPTRGIDDSDDAPVPPPPPYLNGQVAIALSTAPFDVFCQLDSAVDGKAGGGGGLPPKPLIRGRYDGLCATEPAQRQKPERFETFHCGPLPTRTADGDDDDNSAEPVDSFHVEPCFLDARPAAAPSSLTISSPSPSPSAAVTIGKDLIDSREERRRQQQQGGSAVPPSSPSSPSSRAFSMRGGVPVTFQVEPFSRSSAGKVLEPEHLRTPLALEKSMHFLVEYYLRSPHTSLCFTEPFTIWGYLWDRLRSIRTTWVPQLPLCSAGFQNYKDEATGQRLSPNVLENESRRRMQWLEFTVAALSVGSAYLCRTVEGCQRFVQEKKNFLESISQCFTDLTVWYRAEQRSRHAEFVSLLLLLYGLHQESKVEDRATFCPFVKLSMSDGSTVVVPEPVGNSVNLSQVYKELEKQPHLIATQPVKAAVKLINTWAEGKWFEFFYLCRHECLTPLQRSFLFQSFTYARFRAVLDLVAPTNPVYPKLRWRNSVALQTLSELLMMQETSHCVSFLSTMGLAELIDEAHGILRLSTPASAPLVSAADIEARCTNKAKLLLPTYAAFLGFRVWQEAFDIFPRQSFCGDEEGRHTAEQLRFLTRRMHKGRAEVLLATDTQGGHEAAAALRKDEALVAELERRLLMKPACPVNLMEILEPYCPPYNPDVARLAMVDLPLPDAVVFGSLQAHREAMLLRCFHRSNPAGQALLLASLSSSSSSDPASSRDPSARWGRVQAAAADMLDAFEEESVDTDSDVYLDADQQGRVEEDDELLSWLPEHGTGADAAESSVKDADGAGNSGGREGDDDDEQADVPASIRSSRALLDRLQHDDVYSRVEREMMQEAAASAKEREAAERERQEKQELLDSLKEKLRRQQQQQQQQEEKGNKQQLEDAQKGQEHVGGDHPGQDTEEGQAESTKRAEPPSTQPAAPTPLPPSDPPSSTPAVPTTTTTATTAPEVPRPATASTGGDLPPPSPPAPSTASPFGGLSAGFGQQQPEKDKAGDVPLRLPSPSPFPSPARGPIGAQAPSGHSASPPPPVSAASVTTSTSGGTSGGGAASARGGEDESRKGPHDNDATRAGSPRRTAAVAAPGTATPTRRSATLPRGEVEGVEDGSPYAEFSHLKPQRGGGSGRRNASEGERDAAAGADEDPLHFASRRSAIRKAFCARRTGLTIAPVSTTTPATTRRAASRATEPPLSQSSASLRSLLRGRGPHPPMSTAATALARTAKVGRAPGQQKGAAVMAPSAPSATHSFQRAFSRVVSDYLVASAQEICRRTTTHRALRYAELCGAMASDGVLSSWRRGLFIAPTTAHGSAAAVHVWQGARTLQADDLTARRMCVGFSPVAAGDSERRRLTRWGRRHEGQPPRREWLSHPKRNGSVPPQDLLASAWSGIEQAMPPAAAAAAASAFGANPARLLAQLDRSVVPTLSSPSVENIVEAAGQLGQAIHLDRTGQAMRGAHPDSPRKRERDDCSSGSQEEKEEGRWRRVEGDSGAAFSSAETRFPRGSDSDSHRPCFQANFVVISSESSAAPLPVGAGGNSSRVSRRGEESAVMGSGPVALARQFREPFERAVASLFAGGNDTAPSEIGSPSSLLHPLCSFDSTHPLLYVTAAEADGGGGGGGYFATTQLRTATLRTNISVFAMSSTALATAALSHRPPHPQQHNSFPNSDRNPTAGGGGGSAMAPSSSSTPLSGLPTLPGMCPQTTLIVCFDATPEEKASDGGAAAWEGDGTSDSSSSSSSSSAATTFFSPTRWSKFLQVIDRIVQHAVKAEGDNATFTPHGQHQQQQQLHEGDGTPATRIPGLIVLTRLRQGQKVSRRNSGTSDGHQNGDGNASSAETGCKDENKEVESPAMAVLRQRMVAAVAASWKRHVEQYASAQGESGRSNRKATDRAHHAAALSWRRQQQQQESAEAGGDKRWVPRDLKGKPLPRHRQGTPSPRPCEPHKGYDGENPDLHPRRCPITLVTVPIVTTAPAGEEEEEEEEEERGVAVLQRGVLAGLSTLLRVYQHRVVAAVGGAAASADQSCRGGRGEEKKEEEEGDEFFRRSPSSAGPSPLSPPAVSQGFDLSF